jgi:hypothetical protein
MLQEDKGIPRSNPEKVSRIYRRVSPAKSRSSANAATYAKAYLPAIGVGSEKQKYLLFRWSAVPSARMIPRK